MNEQMKQHRSRVLVGVDGSPASRQALVFAANEARMRGSDLVVLSSTDLPHQMWSDAVAELLPPKDLVRKARERTRAVVAEELGGRPAVHVQVVATAKGPAAALVDRSKDADLLVVGSRGHGGFRGLAMGSVSTQCVLHAHCPVTIVRVHAKPAADAKPGSTLMAS